MSFNYRCGKADCRQRVTFKRRIEAYVKEKACSACGGKLNLDTWLKGRRVCRCDAYHYPHRPGSTVWCKQHTTGPTDQDYQDRHVSHIPSQ